MPQGRQVRIAAVGDLHVSDGSRGELMDVLAGINRNADFLALCGDLTHSGKPEQMRVLVEELRAVEIPIVAVLGNHDHEAGCEEELHAILKDGNVHVLNGEGIVLDGVGFVGTKGFVGGFGRRSLAPFGEKELKQFVQHSIEEALRLENAMRNLRTDLKVVVMHYSPVPDTVRGEPEEIYPFLGSSRFLPPIETYGASVIFHGHAHRGTPEGVTPAGIPVFNVALPLLQAHGMALRIWTAPGPDRRAGAHLAVS
jgi:Icc-related predicted phosphoesterase